MKPFVWLFVFVWLFGGFRSEVFGSGEQFLNSASVLQTDLLIADVRMPGMSGLELQERLNAAGSPIPISSSRLNEKGICDVTNGYYLKLPTICCPNCKTNAQSRA
jgi:hypothetical protein